MAQAWRVTVLAHLNAAVHIRANTEDEACRAAEAACRDELVRQGVDAARIAHVEAIRVAPVRIDPV